MVDPALEADELLAYATAAERGELALRVTGMPLGDGEVPPAERAAAFAAAGVDLGARGDHWRIGPWKLFLDGGGSLGTALLYEPWPGTDDYLGNQTTSTSGLNEYAVWAAETGAGPRRPLRRLGGDRPLHRRPARGRPRCGRWPGLGFTAIHAYLWPSAEQMARIRDLDVLVATQSPLQYTFGPGLVRRFGEEAIGRAHPMRSWLESGAIVGGGSDGTGHGVEAPIAPLWAFWQMRARAIEGRDDPIGPAGGGHRRAGPGALHDRRRAGRDGPRARPPRPRLRRRPGGPGGRPPGREPRGVPRRRRPRDPRRRRAGPRRALGPSRGRPRSGPSEAGAGTSRRRERAGIDVTD